LAGHEKNVAKREVRINSYFPIKKNSFMILIAKKIKKGVCLMNNTIPENQNTFKELEKKIYACACESAREITKTILDEYDKVLMEGRDKEAYRNKGKRRTSVKTIYGEVEYERNVYKKKLEDGQTAYIYLLDEAISMDKIGMISTNLAEKIAMTVTESPYRVTAETISSMGGQTISHGGVWNLVQKVGERISQEEQVPVREMEAGAPRGTQEVPVLFEEMDGVWLKMQGKDHKKVKKQEMKVAVTYEGWVEDGKNNSRLYNKRVIAGMEKSEEFHKKREAALEKKYAVDEIEQRILNGDGGSWIKEPYDPDTIITLDGFHVHQEIKRRITEKKAAGRITELYVGEKPDEMLEYINIYADSVESNDESDKRSSNARKLHDYLNNNRDNLLPWKSRGIDILEPAEGIVYKNMGVQENQNCTVITMRMKHRRMRWSTQGANNMGKLLYTKENQELPETINRYTDEKMHTEEEKEIKPCLSAAKAPKKDGKGNPYADLINHKVPLFEGIQTASRKAFKKIFG